ncbi:MAG: DUF1295 domain-containing protein [Myxococcota bacterium]|nr:DUF1295 domain-containing protein [Myxococcota bacterium]
MKNPVTQAAIAIPVILLVAMAIAWSASPGSDIAWGWPVFALCGVFAFAVNWLVFVPSFLGQTERYFDATGSLTYLGLLALALVATEGRDARAWLLAAMVAAWAVRLGSFLFRRIREDGSDGRFDSIKPSFVRFLMAWTLQGLWVFLTLSCALAAMTSAEKVPLGGWALLGGFLWATGFVLEVVADNQKRAFRSDPSNRDRFITSGLWAWSRHPNYVGEITLWVGVAMVAFPALSGGQYLTLISPVFVFVLLTRISGIAMVERRGMRKWGDDPEYRAYLERTPALFPIGRG